MTAKELADLLAEHPRMVVYVSNQSDVIAMHARNLLYALDNGFLNYKRDEPESAFVSTLRAALSRGGELK